MVEMEVFKLALEENSQSPIIILKDKKRQYTLPLWVGALEVMGISIVMNKISMPRPMAHDLILELLQKFGSTLLRAELIDMREGVYYAELVLQKGKKELRVDCRPSDAIALALSANVPIMADEEMLKTIFQPQNDFQAVLDDPESQKWTDVLANCSLDDIKYKL